MSPLHVLAPAGQSTNYRFHSISPEQELSLHKVQAHPAKGSPFPSWMSKDPLAVPENADPQLYPDKGPVASISAHLPAGQEFAVPSMVENILAAQEDTAICISIQLVPPKNAT
jgi:hypothetical protein